MLLPSLGVSSLTWAALAPGLPRASARRAPVACPRRAARKPVLRDSRRSRTRRRRALPRSRWRSAQPRDKLPLVAQADQAELISRIPYHTKSLSLSLHIS